MPFAVYEDALDFWFGRVNFELASPGPDDLRLDRIRSLLRLLGNPHERLRILHVAGSKGKGSTAAMLAAILRQAGYRPGMFTSPHLCSVEERIQVDGRPIQRDELTSLLGEVRDALEASRPRLEPTFFEIATALGFLYFVRRRVDVAIVEVGLGGRFDSTNVCHPALSIITSISFDHTQQLGNRLALIAMEKAGIVKPGRPAISGVVVPEAREVIERTCRERSAPLRQLDVDFSYRYEPGQASPTSCAEDRRPRVQITTRRNAWPPLELGLWGEHQATNAAVAVAAIEQLRDQGWSIPDDAVTRGLAGVIWPARMEVLGHRPLTILDCAHNVASARALVETLERSFPPGRRLLVFGASNDKDVGGMFRILAPAFQHVFLTRFSSSQRGMPPEQAAVLLKTQSSLPHTIYSTVRDAWNAARRMASPDDLICVTGSVFLAGELRNLLSEQR